jgi:ribonuclease G
MSENLLVINVDIREIRVALIEEGILTELHIERLSSRSTLGNVYLGKVSRVLPGMQAAFIDIGQERAAFLHVEDLIRPDDFEAYLNATREAAHSRKAREEDEAPGAEAQPAAAEAPTGGETSERVEDAADDEDSEPSDDERGDDEDAATEDDAGDDEAAEDDAGEDDGEDDEPVTVEAARDAEEGEIDDDESVDVTFSNAGDDEEGDDGDAADEDADDDLEDDEDEEGDEEGARDDDGDDESEPQPAAPLDAEAVEAAVARESAPKLPLTEEAVTEEAVTEEANDGAVEQPRSRGRGRSRRLGTHRAAERRGVEEIEGETIGYTATPLDAGTPVVDAVDQAASDDEDGEAGGGGDGAPGEAEGDEPRRGRRRRRRARVARTGGREETNGQDKPIATSHVAPQGRSAGRRARTQRSTGGQRAGAGTEREGRGERQRDARSDGRSEGRNNDRGRGGRVAKKRGRTQNVRQDKSRISKNTPIRDVVREGQQVIVQVTKEPIGSKGARVSSHISLPGRYVVYLPTVEHVGVSKRIGNDKERSRLRDVIDSVKPPTGGLVVRTMAEGLTKKQLKNDIGYLVRLWDEIARKKEESQQTRRSSTPDLLYEELDLILKTARDLFTEDVARIVIDNREQYGRLRRFVEMFMPERARDVHLYEGAEPIFDAYGIEDEIARALSRKVPLASGGYLIIDQAEALTAIDVNTGRYVGRGSKDLEETILQTNLEAVEEISYQLRFRNIGGLIILDLIDMDRAANREKVRKRLEALLAKDKAKTTFNRISELGLIEMTRKRTRESLGRLLHEPCFYCDGTGQLMSRETIAYEILRQIRREQSNLKGYKITVNAHPAIIDLLKTEERDAVTEVERMFQRRLDLVPRKEYHIEQFDLQGI